LTTLGSISYAVGALFKEQQNFAHTLTGVLELKHLQDIVPVKVCASMQLNVL